MDDKELERLGRGWHPDDSFEHTMMIIQLLIVTAGFLIFVGWIAWGFIKYKIL